MKFLKTRAARKELKEILHYARHTRNMHEDIADPKALQLLVEAQSVAREAHKGKVVEVMDATGDAVIKACQKVAPMRSHPKLREHVEVLFVALAAAMAIRAYIFQPFKIPTGSMQPTLYGITLRHQEPDESTSFPARVVKLFAKGEVYLQYDTPLERIAKKLMIGPPYTTRTTASGVIQSQHTAQGDVLNVYRDNFNSQNGIIYIGSTPQSIPGALLQNGVVEYCRFGEQLKAGDPLLKGVAKAGDYILVNRMKYNFVRPKRGDITVFDTRELTHPQVRKDAYYIKRMVGLPGETISVAPPYLLVNGEKPTDPRFEKLFTSPDYHGYQFAHPTMPAPLIGTAGDSVVTADDEYLFFGDNTGNSLDGRYFGPVNRRQILGSAFFVCLPFDRAGIPEVSH